MSQTKPVLVAEESASSVGRPKTLLDFPFQALRIKTWPRTSRAAICKRLGEYYRAAGGQFHGSFLHPETLRKWERAGRFSREFLEQILVIARSQTGECWREIQRQTENALGVDLQPGLDLEPSKTDVREESLLLLVVRTPRLARRFKSLSGDWSAVNSYLRADRLHHDYICSGLPYPVNPVLVFRVWVHDYLAAMLAAETAAHILFQTVTRHRRGLYLLRLTLATDRPQGDELKRLASEPGFAEAREFQAGLLVPSLAFFEKLESALDKLDSVAL